MHYRDNVTSWSISCGTWFGVQVRLHILFPLLVLYLFLRYPWPLNLAVAGVLFVSVLLHEFGHIAAARLTGGSGDEILMWPLGGLAYVRPANTTSSQILTSAGGVFVNLGLCLATLVPVYQAGLLAECLHPFVMPIPNISLWTRDLLVLTFSLNWLLLLINLIPVMPLDGGQMLRTLIATRMGNRRATEIGTGVGFVVGVLVMIIGVFAEEAWVVLIGAACFISNLIERHQMSQAEVYDDSFMGYDFSQGYTSLERNERAPERRPGFIARWRQKRKAEKEQKRREQEIETERQVDELLEKVHVHGLDSLTEAEKRFLNRASARYRQKGGSPE